MAGEDLLGGGDAEQDMDVERAGIADFAALGLMHWSTESTPVDDVITRVQSVIAEKGMLEIAKGMVAQYAGSTIGEVARLLSACASQRQVRLTETAHALVSGCGLEPVRRDQLCVSVAVRHQQV